ncbi:MAG: hypothetical protein ACH346_05320 [Chthoniobacterales bacterium]
MSIGTNHLIAQEAFFEKHQVTAREYAAFLNAVGATTDPHHLYNEKMGSDPIEASIVRSGHLGAYIYQVISKRDNYPVLYVSPLSQARFCNWLQSSLMKTSEKTNMQLIGEQESEPTEDGAYRIGEISSSNSATFFKTTCAAYVFYDDFSNAMESLANPVTLPNKDFFSINNQIIENELASNKTGFSVASVTQSRLMVGSLVAAAEGAETSSVISSFLNTLLIVIGIREGIREEIPTTQAEDENASLLAQSRRNSVSSGDKNIPAYEYTEEDLVLENPSSFVTAHEEQKLNDAQRPIQLTSAIFQASAQRRSLLSSIERENRFSKKPDKFMSSQNTKESGNNFFPSLLNFFQSESMTSERDDFHEHTLVPEYREVSVSVTRDSSEGPKSSIDSKTSEASKRDLNTIWPHVFSNWERKPSVISYSSDGTLHSEALSNSQRTTNQTEAAPLKKKYFKNWSNPCAALINCFRRDSKERHSSEEPLLSEHHRISDVLFGKNSSFAEDRSDRINSRDTELTSTVRSSSHGIISKATIFARGYLLSPEEMEVIAGKADTWEIQGFFKVTYSSLLKMLKEYNLHKESWDIFRKRQTLGEIEEATKKYLKTEEENLKKNLSSQERDLRENRRKGCTLLLDGITIERFILNHPNTRVLRFDSQHIYIEEASHPGAMSYVRFINSNKHRKRVFKSINSQQMNSLIAANMGIPTDAAKLAERSLATYKLANSLGLKNVPKTELSIIKQDINQSIIGFCQLYIEGEHLFYEEPIKLSLQGAYADPQLQSQFSNRIEDIDSHGKHITRELTSEEIADDIKDLFQYWITEAALARSYLMPPDWELMIDPSETSLTRPNQEDPIYENGKPITEERAAQLFQEEKLFFGKKQITRVLDQIDFSNPKLQQSMADAQIIDFLTGQLDRHAGNFLFKRTDPYSRDWVVYLIDNDLSFPYKFHNISDLNNARGVVLKKLPRLIDQQTAEKVLALSSENIKEILQATGLTEEEISATQDRLLELQYHIREIQNRNIPDGKIVTTWDNVTFDLLKQTVNEKHDNYISRSIEDRDEALKIVNWRENHSSF